MTPNERFIRQVVVDRGWQPGSTLENQVALQLSRWKFTPDEVKQQHRVGRYRLDFAWPDIQMAIEVDGWHHLRPETAAKDASRDSALRAAGWVVLRVDDRRGELILLEQLFRAIHLIRAEKASGWTAHIEVPESASLTAWVIRQRARQDGAA